MNFIKNTLFILAGALKADAKPYLIDVQYLEASNHATVAHSVVQALKSTLGEDDDFSNILLLLTDSAAYMHKMAEGISALLPNCIHLTCLAHGLHRVAEAVRGKYPLVDSFISNVKKVFLKAPRRLSLFKKMNPDLPLPPKPTVTRWGTWVKAALYYADNFDAVKRVIDELDPEDAQAILNTKDLIVNRELQNQLVYIKVHFANLPEALLKLQDRSLKAPAAWQVFSSIMENFLEVEFLQNKVTAILHRNKGIRKLLPILLILQPGCATLGLQPDCVPNLQPAALAAFFYAPLTTVDVERSFSRYAAILRSNRRRFQEDNLRKYMLVHCNRF